MATLAEASNKAKAQAGAGRKAPHNMNTGKGPRSTADAQMGKICGNVERVFKGPTKGGC